ncbi:MAG: class I tRNA ligase family protein, partial [Patescibacteria group bacterium]
EIVKIHGLDEMRYFLLREVTFGGDGDFSYTRFSERYESDLSKGVGNFVSRVLAMAAKMSDDTPSFQDEERVLERVREAWQEYEEAFDRTRPDEALAAVIELISYGDKYIEEKKPWAVLKTDNEEYTSIMGTLLELVRQVSLLLYPFMPQTAQKVWRSLGVEEQHKEQYLAKLKEWGTVKIGMVTRGEALFPPK